MPNLLDLAVMSSEAYHDLPPLMISTGSMLYRRVIFSKPSDSFFAVAYHDSQANDLIVSFRGTDSLVDWTQSNLPLARHLPPHQLRDSIGFVEAAKRHLGAERPQLWTTGHSLGGALATLVATELCAPGVAFNAPRVGRVARASPSRAMTDLTPKGSGFLQVRENRDLVSQLPFDSHVGRVLEIKSRHCAEIHDRTNAARWSFLTNFTLPRSPQLLLAAKVLQGVNWLYWESSLINCDHSMESLLAAMKENPLYRAPLPRPLQYCRNP